MQILNPIWNGAANACMVSQWAPKLLRPKCCSPCWSGFHQSWQDTSMPPCHFFHVKKNGGTLTSCFVAKHDLLLSWPGKGVRTFSFKMMKNVIWDSVPITQGRTLVIMSYGWSLHKAMRAVLFSLRDFLGFWERSNWSTETSWVPMLGCFDSLSVVSTSMACWVVAESIADLRSLFL